MNCCLSGVRVLDLSRHQAGPRGAMMLSDLGAEVIKIEKPGGEETRLSGPFVNGQSIYFSTYNRGKKSLCLDLRHEAGKQTFFDLVRTADIVFENFRPGTLERMGLGYEELSRIKPDIILVRVSGFGQTGSNRLLPGFDPLGQAMSGLMALNGLGTESGAPMGTSFSVVDRMTALHAAIGALGALRHRDRTGEGQVVDACLMDVALTMTEIPVSYYLSTGTTGGEDGRPPYEAKDGWVVIAAGSSERLNRLLAGTVGVDPDAASAGKREGGLSFFGPRMPELIAWCKQRTVSEICEHFGELGVPCGPVLSIPEVSRQKQLWEREVLKRVDDKKGGSIFVPGVSIKFSKTEGKTGDVPLPGEHSDEILVDLLGYDRARVEELRSTGVI